VFGEQPRDRFRSGGGLHPAQCYPATLPSPSPCRRATSKQVIAHSPAANIRDGVTVPGLGAEVFYLQPSAGSVLGTPTTSSDLGAPLIALLQSVFDRYTDFLEGQPLPASVSVVLRLESDTPTRATSLASCSATTCTGAPSAKARPNAPSTLRAAAVKNAASRSTSPAEPPSGQRPCA
jgi:hypothetical protein